MVCQICGKKSGYYPLCAEHFRMRDDGLVIKCKECGKWHLKAEGCSQCKHEERDSSEIMYERGLLESWGKKLYRIVKLGEEDAATDYDLDLYSQIMEVSGDLHNIWQDLNNSVVYISKDQLDDWSANLENIARDGLDRSDDRFDIGRYSDVL